ncbi:MAG: 16S rRNA (adenine1518-N6/adenine1519-N6)-dimethyltransferase [Limisphaerales bacterium]|jgi:16S rRNA (adenine1518-N6/adenine1519-N6)-dimethyltransferase
MKLAEIKALLRENDIRLTRSLGQSFMHDENQVVRIADLAEISPTDDIFEIGPGLGPLTEVLLQRAKSVLAIEVDARLVEVLKKRFTETPALGLIHTDALAYVKSDEVDWSDWKLVSNLPFSVGSPILVELARPGVGPRSMTVTLQKEVADRIAAPPGCKAYGVLTLLLKPAYELDGNFLIPADCYFPAPGVDTSCIRLTRRAKPLVSPSAFKTYVRIVKRGFSQRRKMMLKLLKQDWPVDKLAAAFEAAGLDEKIRAEALTIDQFVTLTESLADS